MLKCGQLDCIFILEMTKIEKKKNKVSWQGILKEIKEILLETCIRDIFQ